MVDLTQTRAITILNVSGPVKCDYKAWLFSPQGCLKGHRNVLGVSGDSVLWKLMF